MIAYLAPVALSACCWVFSLRRTPYAVLWAALLTGSTIFGEALVAVVAGEHHTLGGMLAIELAAAALPLAFVFGTENTCAEYPKGEIATWRRRSRRRGLRRGRWTIDCRSTTQGVDVYVVNGNRERHVGAADPVKDLDAFLELKVRAEDAASTLNALKIDR